MESNSTVYESFIFIFFLLINILQISFNLWICKIQLTCVMNNLLVQWATYLCNEQLTCAMNNLLVQWTTYLCNESFLRSLNLLSANSFISQIRRSVFSFTLNMIKLELDWNTILEFSFGVKYFNFFTTKLTVQKYLFMPALSGHENFLEAQEYV